MPIKIIHHLIISSSSFVVRDMRGMHTITKQNKTQIKEYKKSKKLRETATITKYENFKILKNVENVWACNGLRAMRTL